MKRLFLLSLACAGSLCAVAAPEKTPAAAAEQSVQTRLATILQDMVKKNSDDFYDAAALVYDATGDVTAFIRMMSDMADKGNAAAKLWKARHCYIKAAAQRRNSAEGLKLLEGAVASRYVPAMVEYAAKATLQTDDEKLAKRGMSVLMDACRQGSPKARALYLTVSGRIQNGGLTQPEIVSELKKKNFYLEEMIASLQVEQESGVVWLERAAEHGSSFAPFILSQAVTDAAKSSQYLQLAVERHEPAALGHVGMQTTMAEMVQNGGESAERMAQGMRSLGIAAMLNTPAAVQMLAFLYANGQGTDIPRERIAELFRLAHECGEPNGTAGLGYCKVLGAGCPQDVQGGIALMEQARDKGSNWVNQALASLYFNGDGVKADMRKAIDAFSEDHLNGNRHAYAMMAVLTALGNDSAKPDPRSARVYLNMAISGGDVQAQQLYDVFLKEGKWRFMDDLTR